MTTETENKGWKIILNSSRAHYFVNGHALCGKWMILTTNGLEDFDHFSPDNCKTCMKKREKLAATKIYEGL